MRAGYSPDVTGIAPRTAISCKSWCLKEYAFDEGLTAILFGKHVIPFSLTKCQEGQNEPTFDQFPCFQDAQLFSILTA